MSYNQNNTDILSLFYNKNTNTSKSNTNIPVSVTNYYISNNDISNSYIGLGTNSKISVSSKHSINYFYNSSSLGDLFELNLPIFSSSAVINTDFKIWPTSGHNGLLIQFLKSTTISFNSIYNINMNVLLVGGGGGGGGSRESNAGAGGGAGELVTGTITTFSGTGGKFLDIIIGSGGNGAVGGPTVQGNTGGLTYIYYKSSPTVTIDTIYANGGTGGGSGKGSSQASTGASTGGAGSYSAGVPTVGIASDRTISSDGIFTSMTSYNYAGGTGQDDNNDNGTGGGGGGSGGVGVSGGTATNQANGGAGKTLTYGTTNFSLAGGGGGGRGRNVTIPSSGSAGGGNGGYNTSVNGTNATDNTGSGGGGSYNDSGNGGNGGSGTVILYITAADISIA
jgi:hypothetical protein